MKTLLLTLEYPPFKGGVSSYYENLIKHWPEKGDIYVIDNNNDYYINKKLPILKWIPAYFRLKKYLKANQIDHIIVGNILPIGTIALMLKKKFKFKYSIILHGTDIAYAQKQARKKKLADKIIKNADRIICNSSNTKDLLIKYSSQDAGNKALVVNPGINLDVKVNEKLRNKIKSKINADKNIVLFSISRLIKRKGVDRTIQAFRNLINYLPNATYFIGGTGPDEEYLKEIRNELSSVRSRIHFLGKITEEAKWAWLDLCDMFVLPIREEEENFDGFGIVYIEANLMGKAVIAGKSGGIRDAVEDNVNGILVDPNNIDEITNAIIQLAQDEELRNQLGQTGKERAIQNFNWKNQIEKIYNFIK